MKNILGAQFLAGIAILTLTIWGPVVNLPIIPMANAQSLLFITRIPGPGGSGGGGGGGGTAAKIAGGCNAFASSGGTTSPDADTTGANFIVFSVNGDGAGTVAPANVTDSKSNSAPSLLTFYGGTGAGTRGTIIGYWTNPTVGANHNFTLSLASSFAAFCWEAWSNMLTSSVVVSGSDVGTSRTQALDTDCQTPSIIPGSGQRVLFTSAESPTITTFSIDSGFTKTGQIASGTSEGGSMASLQQASGSTLAPTWSMTHPDACAGAAFKGQ